MIRVWVVKRVADGRIIASYRTWEQAAARVERLMGAGIFNVTWMDIGMDTGGPDKSAWPEEGC